MRGIFAVNKPKGPSSAWVINRLKNFFNEKKIGHAGTLDPLATGVLVVGVGRSATKQLRYFMDQEKEYIGVIKLGETSTTDDDEGEKIFTPDQDPKSITEIENIMPQFIGSCVWQRPPCYSAIKVGGQRAYAVARQGGEPLLGPRQVVIKSIKILNYKWPYLQVRVVCGSGTYIRALARDIGERLGCGGYLKSLERTRVGDFYLKDAKTLEELKLMIEKDSETLKKH